MNASMMPRLAGLVKEWRQAGRLRPGGPSATHEERQAGKTEAYLDCARQLSIVMATAQPTITLDGAITVSSEELQTHVQAAVNAAFQEWNDTNHDLDWIGRTAGKVVVNALLQQPSPSPSGVVNHSATGSDEGAAGKSPLVGNEISAPENFTAVGHPETGRLATDSPKHDPLVGELVSRGIGVFSAAYIHELGKPPKVDLRVSGPVAAFQQLLFSSYTMDQGKTQISDQERLTTTERK